MKKILTFLFALVVLCPCAFFLTACGNDPKEARVMTVECNPELEFVLDKDNKVVTVNALNDEGNHIISIAMDANTAFENLTAEQAMELFLKLTKENGYLVSVTDEEIEVSISGDSDKLMKAIKETATSYLKTNGINIGFEIDDLDKEDLVEEALECLKEYSSVELNKLNEQEIIELIKQSRLETKDMLTQEIKELYYSLRAEEIKTAKIEALSSIITDNPVIQTLIGKTPEEITQDIEAMQQKMQTFQSNFETQFFSQSSNYQTKMTEFITAKKALLEARLQGTLSAEELKALETTAERAEEALDQAEDIAKTALATVTSAMTTASSVFETILNQVSSMLSSVNMEAINSAVNTATSEFLTEFKTTFSAQMGENSYWAQIELNKGE